MEYIAYLHKNKNSDYGVSFPDFPGCVTAGSTLEEARSMAARALSLHVAGMREDGDSIPEPSASQAMSSVNLGRDFHSSMKVSCHFWRMP
jgi:predicted RNase H-like HicB family nuclease